jgi:ABC-type multidrug transport system fused ATPase/permease subunit
MLKNFNIILKIIDKFYKNNFYLLCAAALVLIIFDTFSVISIYPLIQVIINNSIEIDKIKFLSFLINLDNEVNILIFILVVFLSLFTLKFVFSIISNFMISNFKMDLQKNLSKTLLRKYLKYNLIDFISLKHSELIRNITKETEIMVGAAEALIRIVVEGLVLIFIISIVFYSFPEFTLFVILFFSFGLFIFYFFFFQKNN